MISRSSRSDSATVGVVMALYAICPIVCRVSYLSPGMVEIIDSQAGYDGSIA